MGEGIRKLSQGFYPNKFHVLWQNYDLQYISVNQKVGQDVPHSVRLYLYSYPVFVAPVAHAIQDGNQRFASFGQAVFHFWRDLWVFLPVDQAVCFQFF